MKKLSNRLLLTLLFLFMSSSFVWGQKNWVKNQDQDQIDHTTFNLLRKIALNGESENLEIVLPVIEKNYSLIIKISSTINEGELTIEIYDPKGEKQGNYSIDCQNLTKPKNNKNQIEKSLEILGINKETVTGQITKSIELPMNGNWKVKIIPKNAKGNLEIESNLIDSPGKKK